MSEQTNCDLCGKRCPIGSFGCDRGERAYGQASGKSRSAVADGGLDGLAAKLVEVGRVTSIKASHIQAAGKNPDVMFGVLDEDDVAQLESLLDKLQAGWDAAHAAHRGGHPHRGRR